MKQLFTLVAFAVFIVLLLCCVPSKHNEVKTIIKLDTNGDTLYWEGCIGGWSYTNPYETDSLEWR